LARKLGPLKDPLNLVHLVCPDFLRRWEAEDASSISSLSEATTAYVWRSAGARKQRLGHRG
jgi:hypothetical protein